MKCNTWLKWVKFWVSGGNVMRQNKVLRWIIIHFSFERHLTKASSVFSIASFNKSVHFASLSYFRCNLDENRNFSFSLNDNSTSFVPDLISADMFCFIVSTNSMRSFWKRRILLLVKYSADSAFLSRNHI